MSFLLHRRQFWIGPAHEAPALPGWVQRPLGGGRCLAHDPDLRVTAVQARDDSTWWLLGLAVQTDRTRPDPAGDIARAPTADAVAACAATWTGRWLLLGRDVLYTDAGALLSCYVRPAVSAAGVCVSSSAALLIAPIAPTVSAATNPPLTHRVGMDWYPMPGARHVALTRLLPSRALRLSDGAVSPRALVGSLESPLPYETVLDGLAAYLTDAIRRVAEDVRGTILVPLTSGYDSRLLLAAAVRAGVAVRTYTSASATMPEYDRTLPPVLAAAVGVPHRWDRWDRPGAFDPERQRTYDAHTAGQVVETMRDAMSRTPTDVVAPDDLVLPGTVFELGRAFYWSKLPTGVSAEPAEPAVVTRALGQAPHPSILASLGEWNAWVRKTPHPGLDWRDRFYLEQRTAGWAAALMQGADLLDHQLLPIANARAFFDLVLQVPPDIRRRSQHHVDLIQRLAPALAVFPFNPPAPLYRRLLRAARVRLRRWRGRASNA
jgi:hypothetical protein